ncbi:MAG: GNAT family N-acetyltransferase [Pirellulaceae bacterium]|nr:GNAT family N-acetyltransferase [Planctomycetales bacterium]
MVLKKLSLNALVFRTQVRPTDVAAIGRIVAETGFFSIAEVAVAVELVAERLSKGAESGYEFIVADDHGAVAGYCCYGEIACTVGSYDLYWIAVAPPWQRCGLGRRLLVEAEQAIADRQGRHIYIETSSRSQYAPTRSFYENNNYEIAATLKDFYGDGDSKVIYRKIVRQG